MRDLQRLCLPAAHDRWLGHGASILEGAIDVTDDFLRLTLLSWNTVSGVVNRCFLSPPSPPPLPCDAPHPSCISTSFTTGDNDDDRAPLTSFWDIPSSTSRKWTRSSRLHPIKVKSQKYLQDFALKYDEVLVREMRLALAQCVMDTMETTESIHSFSKEVTEHILDRSGERGRGRRRWLGGQGETGAGRWRVGHRRRKRGSRADKPTLGRHGVVEVGAVVASRLKTMSAGYPPRPKRSLLAVTIPKLPDRLVHDGVF